MGLICEEGLSKVRAYLETLDPENRQVVAIFKIKIKQDGEIVKSVILDLVKVELYEADDYADCIITLNDGVLADILSRKLDALEALQQDLIEVEGDLNLLKVLKEQISKIG